MEWQGMFGDDSDEEVSGEANQNEEVKAIACEKLHSQRLCSVRSIEGIGGGRGVFAEIDILPGTLILAEKPIYTWPTDSLLSDPVVLRHCVEEICTNPELFEVTQFLHPLSLHDAEQEEILKIQNLWSSLSLNQSLETRLEDQHSTSDDDLIRVALVLQHNGFNSGLYKYLSLVNHSCVPNCIKFSPLISNKMNWKYVSEIWAIRPIKAGEEITICYVERIEVPYRTMKNYLYQNHHFLCNCVRCKGDVNIGEGVSPIPLVERILETLEAEGLTFDTNQYPLTDVSAQSLLSQNHNSEDMIARTLNIISYIHEIILFLSSPSSLRYDHSPLRNEFQYYSSRDIVYIICRYHQIIITLCVRLIDVYFQEKFQFISESAPIHEDEVTGGVFCYICECYIKHAHELYEHQIQYLVCQDHPLIGETIGHMAQGLKVVLDQRKRQKTEVTRENIHTLDALEALYSSTSQKYPWAKSTSAAKLQLKQYETISSRIENLYHLSYDMLQQHLNFQERILMS